MAENGNMDTGNDDAYEAAFFRAVRAFISSEFETATELGEAARAINPDRMEPVFLFGMIALALGDPGRAIQLMEEGFKAHPNVREFALALSTLYAQVGKMAESVYHSKLALTLKSNPLLAAAAPTNFGDFEGNISQARVSTYLVDASIAFHQREYERAVEYCERELAIDANSPKCLLLYGRALAALSQFEKATTALIKAAELAPNDNENWLALGDALLASGRTEEANGVFRDLVERAPADLEALERTAVGLAYGSSSAWRDYPEIIGKIDSLLRAQRRSEPHSSNRKGVAGVLNVAYLVNEATIADRHELLFTLLARHDSAKVRTFVYQQYSQPHLATVRLRALTGQWRQTYDIDDDTLDLIIRNDDIDVLVDMCGLTPGHRQTVLARRPAGACVSYLGFPVSGIPSATDAVLSCRQTLEADERDCDGIECVDLGEGLVTFMGGTVQLSGAGSGRSPVDTKGHVTFGGVLDLARLPASVDLWRRVLEELPEARLVLGGVDGAGRGVWNYVAHAFGGADVLRRVSILNNTGTASARGNLMTSIDILLDTRRVSGVGEICDALWMGVPAVSLVGDRRSSMMGASILRQAGLSEWCAETEADYVAVAVGLAKDKAALARHRDTLRERIKSSALCDTKAFTARLEEVYRDVADKARRRPA